MKKCIYIAAALAAVLSSCTQNRNTAGVQVMEKVPAVSVKTAVFQDVPHEEVYSSTVVANVVNNITPQSAGRIRKINVEVGDYVQKGQILAEMDKASLYQAELKLANDRTEFERLSKLYEAGALAQSDYEAAELGLRVSEINFKNLEENTVLRAPVDGVISARGYDVDDMYAMASPIFVLQQISPVKLIVGVSETDYSKVSVGDEVTITNDALPSVVTKGYVSRVYPVVDPVTHTVSVEVKVPNKDRLLRPGMYSRVKICFAVNRSIVVPDVAVLKQQGSGVRYVYVLGSDNTVSVRDVTVGLHMDGSYEILSGLKEGEKVVVKGLTALRNGAAVEVIG